METYARSLHRSSNHMPFKATRPGAPLRSITIATRRVDSSASHTTGRRTFPDKVRSAPSSDAALRGVRQRYPEGASKVFRRGPRTRERGRRSLRARDVRPRVACFQNEREFHARRSLARVFTMQSRVDPLAALIRQIITFTRTHFARSSDTRVIRYYQNLVYFSARILLRAPYALV